MTMTEPATDLKDGRVVGIAGPVVDVEFPRGALPELNIGRRVRHHARGRDHHGAGRSRPAAR